MARRPTTSWCGALHRQTGNQCAPLPSRRVWVQLDSENNVCFYLHPSAWLETFWVAWFFTQIHFPLQEPSSQDIIVGWAWEVACPPVGQACLPVWQISWVSVIFIGYSQQFSSEVLPPPLCRGGPMSGRGLPKSITCSWSLLFLSIRLSTFQMQHGASFLWNKDLCALFFCGKAFLPFSAFSPSFHFQTLPTLRPTQPSGPGPLGVLPALF